MSQSTIQLDRVNKFKGEFWQHHSMQIKIDAE